MEEMKQAKLPKMKNASELEKAKDQMMEVLKNDPRLYSLIHDSFHLTYAETKRSLSPLLDLYQDLQYCDHCPGYDHCDKEVPHYQMTLNFEDGLVDRQLVMCPIAKKRETYLASFIDHDFPLAWMDRDLSSFNGKNKKNLMGAIAKTLQVKEGEVMPCIYVNGSRGTGRTYTLACLANMWVKRGFGEVAFIETSRLVEKLRNAYYERDKEKFHELMERYSTCSLLVLDDFGNEAKDKNGFTYSTILYPLLNARAKQNLCTCFSSDFSIDEIAEMYAPTLGIPRARQFKDLLVSLCKKSYALHGISQW